MLYTEWFGKLLNWQKTWQGLYSHLHIRKLLKLLQLKMHMEGLYDYINGLVLKLAVWHSYHPLVLLWNC